MIAVNAIGPTWHAGHHEDMRILTYKRTHTGDPDGNGNFGVNDCMGRIRSWGFDAVIGVGGYGPEPQSLGIEGRINWVGLNPTWRLHPKGFGEIVNFEFFTLLEEKGPFLISVAPLLAKRMYEKKARVLFKSYSPAEKAEAEKLILYLLRTQTGKSTSPERSEASNRCRPRKRVRGRCPVTD